MKRVVLLLLIISSTFLLSAQIFDSITDARDGQVYRTVKIGNQWWMAENLKATQYSDSTTIPLVEGTSEWDALTYTEKAYCYYDSSTSNKDVYGALYTWAAAMNGATSSSANPSGVQGACPEGWHVPSDAEWTVLTDYLGGQVVAADKMRETGTVHWDNPNTGATNSSGFSALPGGYRGYNSIFYGMGRNALFWSSTEGTSDRAFYRALAYDSPMVGGGTNYKDYGLSVRCVKNPPVYPMSLEFTANNVSGIGGIDGSIDLTVSGGDSPYTFLWSNDSTSENLSGISAGVYSVAVTDSRDSTITDSIRIYDTFVDDSDGQVYKTVKIGDQWWMVENLKATKYLDGTPILHVTGDDNWDTLTTTDKAYCWYNDDSTTNAQTYGPLYTWAAAMNSATSSSANPSGVQGACPDGWHVPSDAEWKELEMYLGMSQAEADGTGYRGTDEGGKLKETGTTYWDSPNTSATNSSGFSALPGGCRNIGGYFYSMDFDAYFWSSTEGSSGRAWGRLLTYNNSEVYRSDYYQYLGFSVRCVKDTATNPLKLSLEVSHVFSLGGNDGIIDLTVSGGELPYTFLWSNDSSSEDIIGLSSGVYSVTVSDARDSTITDSIRIYDTFLDERDGQRYKAVTIGDQIWTAENIRATKYADGTDIPLVEGTSEWDALSLTDKAYCVYNNSDSLGEIYGAFYTWAAAMNGEASSDANPSRVQGVCPDGWHLPSDTEWKDLEMYLGMSQSEVDGLDWRGTDEGGKLKENDTIHWLSPNTGATNESGFTALPGGYRHDNGNFYEMGFETNFWSSTEWESSYAWFRKLAYSMSEVARSSLFKYMGYSVRCVKDSVRNGYLTVTDKDSIPVSKLDFSNDRIIDTVVITNTNDTVTVSISSVSTGTNAYHLSLSSTDLTPGTNVELILTLNRCEIGSNYIDTIQIESNDPVNPLISIPLSADRDSISVNICIVTVDPETDKNLVVWEKPNDERISLYYIYREGTIADQYEIIGSIASGELSVYEDITSEPEIKSYRYKISAVDTCGNESIFSHYHKTMLLTSSLGPDRINLAWLEYQVEEDGLNFSEYIIYRGSEPNLLSQIDNIPGSINAYSDINPLVGNNYYRIAGVLADPCYPTDNLKAGAGPYLHSLSNLEVKVLTPGVNKAPTNIILDSTAIDENLPGQTLIGRFTTSDPNPGDSHIYAFAIGSGDIDNSQFIISGDSLLSAVVFDYESKDNYSIRVITTDTGNLSFEEQITILINDVFDPEIIEASIIDSSNISCYGLSDGTATVTAWGGTPPYTYLWDDDSATTDVTVHNLLPDRWYHVKVSDENMQTAFDSLILTEPEELNIEKDYSPKACANGTNGYINLDISGGTPPYFYSWSNGSDVEDLTGIPPGAYSVEVTDQNNCYIGDTITLDAIVIKIPSICLITLNIDRKNLIVWEQDFEAFVENYIIYKEDIGGYTPIATIPSNQLSVYVDQYSNPAETQYLYKIRTINICGDTSTFSNYHKTVHLTASHGLGDEIILNWHTYEIESESNFLLGYEIYRSHSSEDLIISSNKLDMLTPSKSSYTDLSPPTGPLYYQVAAVKLQPCYPGILKTGEPIDKMLSNIYDYTVGIGKNYYGQIITYPNPFNSSTTLRFNNPEGNPCTLYIMDLTGMVCRIVNNITSSEYVLEKGDLKEGFYFVELRGPKIYRSKIVIE